MNNTDCSSIALLSIIIPAYNSDRFIANTLSLLVSQGLEDCEVIIVNDGSTDQTEMICHAFTMQYENIKIINIKNSGVSIARNTGLLHATGKYVYFFDSDDALTEGSIDFFKRVLLSGSNFQIFSFGYEMWKNGKIKKRYVAKKYSKVSLSALLLQENFFSKKLPCSLCSCIYERVFLVENELSFTPNLKIGEDVEFIIKSFSLISKSFYYESRVCYIYQIRDDSVMQGYKKYSIDQFNSFFVVKEFLVMNKKKYPAIAKETDFFMANLYVYNLFYYLFSELKSSNLNNQFMINKHVLSKKISGISFRYLIIHIIKIMPLNALFYLCGKCHK
jgi:glycosyltransferase involved in cell wall biosynthesis